MKANLERTATHPSQKEIILFEPRNFTKKLITTDINNYNLPITEISNLCIRLTKIIRDIQRMLPNEINYLDNKNSQKSISNIFDEDVLNFICNQKVKCINIQPFCIKEEKNFEEQIYIHTANK